MTTLKYHSTTTLRMIREAHPCQDGWRKLTKNLGGINAYGLDTPLTLLQVLDSNGLEDALWVLSHSVPNADRLARHFQAWCAEQVLHIYEAAYPGDDRVRNQIAMLRRDDVTCEERVAAHNAARDAACSACDVWDAKWASEAAWASARETPYFAALDARDAKREAARVAALAERDDEWAADAALAEARASQEAKLREMLLAVADA